MCAKFCTVVIANNDLARVVRDLWNTLYLTLKRSFDYWSTYLKNGLWYQKSVSTKNVKGSFPLIYRKKYCPINNIRGQNDIPHNITRLCDTNCKTNCHKIDHSGVARYIFLTLISEISQYLFLKNYRKRFNYISANSLNRSQF